MPGRCRKFTPPKNIPPETAEAIRKEAIRAFRALGFRSYGRIDGFYLEDGRILITDPNSSSGMAPSSFFFEQAACAGMLPSMILSRLIENAMVIHRGKCGPL
jgi:D-alanine-D-alanine ligase-like ATP-grasp enzyme